MHRLLLTLAITTTVGSLLSSNPAAAQVLPAAKRAERVEITTAPALELATDHLTIIRWTTNNPGGSDVHYGIVHWNGSQGPDPDGEISHQAEPGPTIHGVPRAHGGPQATDDLLLQGDLGGEQWQERWGEERRQHVHHTRSRRANRGVP